MVSTSGLDESTLDQIFTLDQEFQKLFASKESMVQKDAGGQTED